MSCALGVAQGATLAHWTFGDDGFADVSGNGYNLVSEGVTINADGRAVFDGSQTKLDTCKPLDLSACTAVTVEMVVRTTSDAKSILAEFSDNYNTCIGSFSIWKNPDWTPIDNAAVGTVYNANGSFNQKKTTATQMSDGDWHHIALVIDTTKSGVGMTTLYFDGVAQPSGSASGSANTPFPSDQYLHIGVRKASSSVTNVRPFIGEMKKFRVSSGVLTPAAFLPIEDTAAELVAWWPFGAHGAADVSGNGHDLHLSGTGVTQTDGALAFDGSQGRSYTVRPLDLRGYRELTVEFWARTTSKSGSGMALSHTVRPMADDPNRPGAWYFNINEAGAGKVRFATRGEPGYDVKDTSADLADGAWHHYAAVFNTTETATPGKTRFYVDGVEVAQNPGANFSSTAWATLRNGYLYLGTQGIGNSLFTGDIDDVRITSAALRPAQFMTARTATTGTVVANVPAAPAASDTLAHWKFGADGFLQDETGAFELYRPRADMGLSVADAARFVGHGGPHTYEWLNLAPFSAVTVECFVREDSTDSNETFLEFSTNTNHRAGGFYLGHPMITDAGIVGAAVKTTDGFNIKELPKGATEGGAWHHLALVMDRSVNGAGWTKFYLDGQLAGEQSSQHNKNATVFGCEQMFFGGRQEGWKTFLRGGLDDVRVTTRALTPGEFLQARSGQDVSDRVIAEWTFDDGLEGGVVRDVSAHGHDLRVSASGVSFARGVASMDGAAGTYMKTTDNLGLSDQEAVTIECWARTRRIANAMFVKVDNSDNAGQCYIGFEQNGTKYYTRSGMRTSSTENQVDEREVTADSPEVDGRWHHYAAVFDRSKTGGEFGRLYIDGALVTHTKDGVNIGVTHGTDSWNGTLSGAFPDAPMVFGNNNDSGTGTYPFQGDLGHVRVTAGVLTPDEFLGAPSEADETVAWWPFNRRAPLADASENGHDLVQDGDGAAWDKASDALAFAGDAATTLRTAETLDLRGFDAVTVECFVKTPGSDASMFLFAQGHNPDATAGGLQAFWAKSDGFTHARLTTDHFWWRVNGNVAEWMTLWNSDVCREVALDNSRWHHVALVVDNAKRGDDRAVLYVDYEPCATVDANSGRHASDAVTKFLNSTFQIGGVSRDSGNAPFKGLIDDVRVTGRALAPAEFLRERSALTGLTIIVR